MSFGMPASEKILMGTGMGDPYPCPIAIPKPDGNLTITAFRHPTVWKSEIIKSDEYFISSACSKPET